jgi:hypothetical protein
MNDRWPHGASPSIDTFATLRGDEASLSRPSAATLVPSPGGSMAAPHIPSHKSRLRRAGAAFLVIAMVGVGSACSPSAAPATVLPTPSAGAATPGPGAASPTGPSAVDSAAVLDAFRAFIQTEQSFHLTADAKLTIAGQSVEMDVAEDVSGGDEKGTVDIRGRRISVHFAVVIVDGKAYVKLVNRKWQSIDIDTSSSNPLGDLEVDGLKPIDIVKVNGVTAHHFRADDPKALDPDTITGNAVTSLKLKSAVFDIYVDADGKPLTAILTFSGRGKFQGKSSPIEATIRYDFSRFGVPVEIEAPI